LEVISTLQRESDSKDNKIKLLEGQMDTERENSRLEKESIINDYENQISGYYYYYYYFFFNNNF